MDGRLEIPMPSVQEPSSNSIPPAEHVAMDLERLMAMPLTSSEEREQWYEAASTMEQTWERQFPGFEVEHEVWHFFSDADIRARDAGYRGYQHRRMEDYVRRLRGSST